MVYDEYAKALYDMIQDKSLIKDNFDAFYHLYEMEGFNVLLNNPRIKKEEKKNLIKKTLLNFDSLFIDFLFVIVDNNRMTMIKEIKNSFDELVNDGDNIGVVDVYVNGSFEQKDLIEFLEKKLNKKIILNIINSDEIIGGIKVIYKGVCIDYSYQNKMAKMQAWI